MQDVRRPGGDSEPLWARGRDDREGQRPRGKVRAEGGLFSSRAGEGAPRARTRGIHPLTASRPPHPQQRLRLRLARHGVAAPVLTEAACRQHPDRRPLLRRGDISLAGSKGTAATFARVLACSAVHISHSGGLEGGCSG